MNVNKAAAALGRRGGLAGRGESQRRGDSEHYRELRARRQDRWYAVVTFGTPARSLVQVYRLLPAAERAADRAKGSGSCSAARVLACETLELARTADISRVRTGETVVYQA